MSRSRVDAEVISFFDADDEMYPDRLQLIWSYFRDSPSLKALWHAVGPNTFEEVLKNSHGQRVSYPMAAESLVHGRELLVTAIKVDENNFPMSNTEIADGLVTIRRSLLDDGRLRWTNAPNKEDFYFTRDTIARVKALAEERGIQGDSKLFDAEMMFVNWSLSRYIPRYVHVAAREEGMGQKGGLVSAHITAQS
jgi:hypothetical protein